MERYRIEKEEEKEEKKVKQIVNHSNSGKGGPLDFFRVSQMFGSQILKMVVEINYVQLICMYK